MTHAKFFGQNLGHGPVEATGDHVAGSVDESYARQFDDTRGGGFADEAGAFLDPSRRASEQTEQDVGTYVEYTTGSGANVANPASLYNLFDRNPYGNVDESVGRQFDTTPGGGTVDEAGRVAGEAAEGARDVAFNVGPDWLDEAALGVGGLLGLAVLAYAFGQLFDVNLGGA